MEVRVNSFLDAVQKPIKDARVQGWNDALEYAANSLQAQSNGTALSDLMDAIAAELRGMKREA